MGMLPRILGLMLLAAIWLPTALLGRSHNNSLQPYPATGTARSETAYTIGAAAESVPFHQFRMSGVPLPLAKGLGWGNDDAWSPGFSRPSTGAIQAPALGATSHDFTQTWQFSQRTARSPRAPCPL
jgi:hypothetical protein